MPKVSEEHVDIRRRQIIDAAYRCFARKGFHQTTMRDIFAESGLSPGAVYHYFKSKDDIIEASFVFDYQRSLPVFARAADETDPLVAIENLLAFFYAGLESAAALGADRVNIQGWGEALFSPRLLPPLHDIFQTFRRLLAELIQRGQASGRIASENNPEASAEVLFSTYLGLYLQKALIPDLNVERYRDAVITILRGDFASVEALERSTRQAKESEDGQSSPSY